MSDEYKKEKSDFVIFNNADLESLKHEVEKLNEILLKKTIK